MINRINTLEEAIEISAEEIIDAVEESFEDGEVCECYLQGLKDGIELLTEDIYAMCEDELPAMLPEILTSSADVMYDILRDDRATLSELAFAADILDRYMSLVMCMADEFGDDDYECCEDCDECHMCDFYED